MFVCVCVCARTAYKTLVEAIQTCDCDRTIFIRLLASRPRLADEEPHQQRIGQSHTRPTTKPAGARSREEVNLYTRAGAPKRIHIHTRSIRVIMLHHSAEIAFSIESVGRSSPLLDTETPCTHKHILERH